MNNFSRRTFAIVAALLFLFSAFTPSRPVAAGDPCNNCTTHAIITCQSATFKSSYSWSSTTLGTLYYGRKIGARNANNYYDGTYHTTNGFMLILDYPSGRWGYVTAGCVGGFRSW